jgi:hypothetical protein
MSADAKENEEPTCIRTPAECWLTTTNRIQALKQCVSASVCVCVCGVCVRVCVCVCLCVFKIILAETLEN